MAINPNALAESGDYELDQRPGVQPVTDHMIRHYAVEVLGLPVASAAAFAAWLDESWNGFNEDGVLTNGQVIEGALYDWRGGM